MISIFNSNSKSLHANCIVHRSSAFNKIAPRNDYRLQIGPTFRFEKATLESRLENNDRSLRSIDTHLNK